MRVSPVGVPEVLGCAAGQLAAKGLKDAEAKETSRRCLIRVGTRGAPRVALHAPTTSVWDGRREDPPAAIIDVTALLSPAWWIRMLAVTGFALSAVTPGSMLERRASSSKNAPSPRFEGILSRSLWGS